MHNYIEQLYDRFRFRFCAFVLVFHLYVNWDQLILVLLASAVLGLV